ncbi:MAG: DUF983 domain-containing protein [Pseudomonadota bacterium]
MDEPPSSEGQRSLSESALLGLCPACGARGLFSGVVRFSDRCGTCGLDYSSYNVGDGPAALLIMLVGAIVVTGAVSLQLSQHPPFWVHILLWVPISTALVVGLLRVAKAALLITEHRRQARDGRKEK